MQNPSQSLSIATTTLMASNANGRPQSSLPGGESERGTLLCLLSSCIGTLRAGQAVDALLRQQGTLGGALANAETMRAVMPVLGPEGLLALQAVQQAAQRLYDAHLLTHLQVQLMARRDSEALALYFDAGMLLIKEEFLFAGMRWPRRALTNTALRQALGADAAVLVLGRRLCADETGLDPQEISLAQALHEDGRMLGLRLHDYVVVGPDGMVSLRQSGMLPPAVNLVPG